jgi:bifunctional DNA-binding transcriptional regulator/antitoxin component of YhaV-PrlF toxin-antitoxin module
MAGEKYNISKIPEPKKQYVISQVTSIPGRENFNFDFDQSFSICEKSSDYCHYLVNGFQMITESDISTHKRSACYTMIVDPRYNYNEDDYLKNVIELKPDREPWGKDHTYDLMSHKDCRKNDVVVFFDIKESERPIILVRMKKSQSCRFCFLFEYINQEKEAGAIRAFQKKRYVSTRPDIGDRPPTIGDIMETFTYEKYNDKKVDFIKFKKEALDYLKKRLKEKNHFMDNSIDEKAQELQKSYDYFSKNPDEPDEEL